LPANLIRRIATGIVFIPVLFFVIRSGGWLFTSWVFLTVAIGAWEWWRLVDPHRSRGELALIAAGVIGTFQGAIDPDPARLALFLALFLVIALLCSLRHGDGNANLRSSRLVLGMLYLGLLPAFLIRIRAFPDGAEALYLTYLTVFACDSLAYATGKLVGGRKLWPRISPSKTWAGAIGGLSGALIAAVVGQQFFAHFLSLPGAIGFGLIAGILSQFGDLVESLWKRETGVKDSSTVIPGHGGILDRFDGLHFISPVIYSYLMLFIN
jgi:phosphatidate cytidylyltransferase